MNTITGSILLWLAITCVFIGWFMSALDTDDKEV